MSQHKKNETKTIATEEGKTTPRSEEQLARIRRSKKAIFIADETVFEHKKSNDGNACAHDANNNAPTKIVKVQWKVIGSSGKLYEIDATNEHKWTCSCPDFQRRHQHCKHIYFIMNERLSGKVEQWSDIATSLQQGCRPDQYHLVASAAQINRALKSR